MTKISILRQQWINGSVVVHFKFEIWGPQFESRIVPLFHWVATLGKLFLSSKKLGYKRVFGA